MKVIMILKVIPMMNPDGVYLGNYRGSLLGRCILANRFPSDRPGVDRYRNKT